MLFRMVASLVSLKFSLTLSWLTFLLAHLAADLPVLFVRLVVLEMRELLKLLFLRL